MKTHNSLTTFLLLAFLSLSVIGCKNNDSSDMGSKDKAAELTAVEAEEFILEWAGVVTASENAEISSRYMSDEYTDGVETRSKLISNYFSENGVLRGTVSRLIRFQKASLVNALNTSGTDLLNDPAVNEINVQHYFKYFNAITIPGLSIATSDSCPNGFSSSNNFYLKLTNDIGQYMAYAPFRGDSGAITVALMTFTVQKNNEGQIHIVSLHSSPIYNEDVPLLEENQLNPCYFPAS
ncbi:MAG: hypothetical protein CMC26_00980 [Flavobacteriaceae bacterium]|nr:hypothetical protein [Flavobacteriaceae bacterium]|tara:strand:+ start:1434 stop:2144 length:711 start_codon:yes stop_codon:yes gene_type:complete